ncbi:MAG: pentapeptide repeat-containing protein [Acidobacteria bacterium]|jgi:uncharacterized protein YjbI with pentapeptide repeats|nr:pentapeptide repeat-containing protein [Acidobacteriota bacterium]
MKKFGNITKDYGYTLLIVLSLCIIVLFFSVYAQNFKDWTGFSADEVSSDVKVVPVKIYQSSKTLWDWLQLLLIPLMVAIIAYLLNESQQKRQRETEQNKQYQNTLDAYFDRMTELLLKEKLRESLADSEVRTLARTLSLTALKNSDGKRKGQIVQFLYESKLIFKGKDKTVINLVNADLTGADLSGLRLENVLLSNCRFSKANFKRAMLEGANLQQSSFHQSDMKEVQLDSAELGFANFSEADLKGATFWGASCELAHFENANLSGAMFGSDIQLSLDGKNMMQDAVLSTGNGDSAAIFADANLTKACVKTDQLKSVCLNNAIMPDGTRYEKWLKKQEKDFKEIRHKTDINYQDSYNEYKKKKRKKLLGF